VIVISGITSSLGISLSRLLAAKGIQVLGFARHIDRARKLLIHPLIDLRKADLCDTALMRSICSGSSTIVHLAALSSPWGKYTDFFRTNVEGTASIVQAAKASTISRFIHISSPSIYFDYTDRYNVKEDDSLPLRCVNAYAQTKKLAEEVVDQAFIDGLPCITLRPRALFGPHDHVLFPRVINACQKNGIPCFRPKSPVVDITYVDNAAAAILCAIEAPSSCCGQKYNITNGEPVLLWDLLRLLLTKLSLPVRTRKIPYQAAYSAAFLAELFGRITGIEPRFTRYGVGVMAFSQTLCIDKARKELGYRPEISLHEGVDRYVNWVQS
jgi:nucleoside-diphosphate-sugar epimerase